MKEPMIGSFEPEGKYRVDDLYAVRLRLNDFAGHLDPPSIASWKSRRQTHEEDNRMYDFLGLFERAGWSVRLRKKNSGLSEKLVLTVKGKDVGITVKNRPEYIDREIPRCLGKLISTMMSETGSYQKVRETYTGEDGVEICLDQPYITGPRRETIELGTFVEIEVKGNAARAEEIIEEWKKRLGITSEAIRESYAGMARKKRSEQNG